MRAFHPLVVFAVMAIVGCAGAVSEPTLFRTTRGVEAFVDGAPDDIEARARIALAELGIDTTRYVVSPDGARRLLEGRVQDLQVSVVIHRDGETATRTEVIAWRSAASWDRRIAARLLSRITILG